MKRLGGPMTTPSKILTWAAPDVTPEKRRAPPISLTNASPTKQLQRKGLTAREQIKTYVFFDLECTGLIKNSPNLQDFRTKSYSSSEELSDHLNGSCIETRLDHLPHITEMSFCAIPKETFDELKQERKAIEHWNEANPEHGQELVKFVPLNTHTRQVNPNITERQWNEYHQKRSQAHGAALVHQKRRLLRCNSFEKEWPGVVQFLDSLEKPAVLIGHNALEYDLRVIYAEMKRYELLENYKIPKDVFFVDSLIMARHVEREVMAELSRMCKLVKFRQIQSHEQVEGNKEEQLTVGQDSVDPFAPSSIRAPTSVNGVFVADHPSHSIDWNCYSIAIQKRIRKDGFVRKPGGGWDYKPAEPNKYKLGIIYEQLLGSTFTAHFAQPDAEALMHVCLSYGDEFTQYADTFAAGVPF